MSNTTICDQDTPDPWMINHNGRFYLTFTLGDRVEIWASDLMEDWRGCERSVIWKPPPNSPWSADLWAPELHHLNGKWYIYFCGAPPGVGNPGHRTLLLRSNNISNPLDPSSWTFLGPIPGLPDHQWSIDATVFTITGSDLYLCYSGWPLGDNSDTQQDLFLIRMHDPENAEPATLTCISRATLQWERPDGGKRGVNEGPTFISLPPSQAHPTGFKGIIFSAHGSWTCEYKLGVLALVNSNNPCNESSWQKRQTPLLVSDESKGGPFGPGHASFLPSPWHDGRIFCVYHGTERKDEGWANRKARVLSLNDAAFCAGAGPVYCATGSGYAGMGGLNNASGDGNAMQNSSADEQKQGNNMGGRMFQEVEKRVPPQYKGVLDKVRKLF